jgi:CHAT domain-containing protein/tetratricopeptide (TPR) repeat protein
LFQKGNLNLQLIRLKQAPMKNKLFKNTLLILLCSIRMTASAQTDTVAIQWQQFMEQLDTITIESSAHFPIARKLIDFAEKHYPKTHSNYNISLYHYATGLLLTGKIAQADSLFKVGWTWMQSRQPADTLAYAQWYTLKGNLFQAKKEDATAIKTNDEAIKYLQNTENPALKRYLNDFYLSNASICEWIDPPKMFIYAQKAYNLRALAPHLYAPSPHLVYLLSNYHRNQGNYTQAIAIIEKHLPTYSTDYYYDMLQGLAHIYIDMRLYEKSIAIWKQIVDYVASIDKNDYSYAITLDNYAFALGSGGYYKEAVAATSEALPIFIKTSGKKSFYRLCQSHHIMYGAELQKWDTIKPIIQELEDFLAKTPNQVDQNIEFIRGNLSSVYTKMNNLPRAIYHKEKNVEVMRQLYGAGESHLVTGQRALMGLYLENQQFKSCIPLIQALLEANNTQMVYQFELLDENAKDLYLKNHLQYTIRLSCLALQKYQQKDTLAQQLLYDAFLATKGVVLKGTKRMQQVAATHSDTAVQRLYQTRLGIKKQLGKLYLATDSSKKADKLVLERDLEQVERQLILKLPLLEKSFKNITYQTVQQSLKPRAAAVEFIHYRYRNPKVNLDTTIYAALILKPKQVFPELVFLFDERDLKKILHNAPKITDLYPKRGQKDSKITSSTGNTPAQALYDLIWKPLMPHLDSVETIYYAPSGLLNQLSLDAFMVNDSTFLSNRYQLNRCMSTGELVFEHNAPLTIQSALLYGGIDYDAGLAATTTPAQTRSHHEAQHDPQIAHFQQLMNQRGVANHAWKYLDGTQKEITILNKLFIKQQIPVQVQSQKAASEAHFKGLGQQSKLPTILHLATHGFSFPAPQKDSTAKTAFQDAENPLIRSGLILAGANAAWLGKPIPENQEDGILTAYEIANMQLNDIQLVVLSACETGLGDVRGTEGVYGLQRAFKMAGVPYLVIGLWELPDEPTAVFMELFYQNLLAKQPVRQAFAQAQAQMQLKYEPYYWAGLVLVR